jgi:chemotaxis protein CheZ
MTADGLSTPPGIRPAAQDFDEMRARLDYVVRKSADAVDRVLNSVDQARAEQEQISTAVRELRTAAVGNPLEPIVERLAGLIEASSGRTREHLTDILLAQGFHDLVSQVLAKVGQMVTKLEEHRDTPPAAGACSRPDADTRTSSDLAGPVIDATGQGDVLTNQDEVDALLAKTGL